MATLSEFLTDGFQSLATDLGEQVFEWSGEEYQCVPSTVTSEFNLEMGGLSEEQTLMLTSLKESFSDGLYPKSKDFIRFNELTYRILTQRQDATGAFIKLVCIEDSRGA